MADNLFWLGRYTERLEGTLRLLRCIVLRLLDETSADGSPELAALARMLVRLEMLPARFQRAISGQGPGTGNSGACSTRRTAPAARGKFSTGCAALSRSRATGFPPTPGRFSNKLNIDGRSRQRRRLLADALNQLNIIIIDISAFSGMEMENMTRGLGWRFLEFGRRLERAARIVQWFRAGLCPEIRSTALLEPLLEISDSLMTYRRRYFAGVQVSSVLELLLLDEGNPRSLAFQLAALREHARHFPREADLFHENEERRVAALAGALRDAAGMILSQPPRRTPTARWKYY